MSCSHGSARGRLKKVLCALKNVWAGRMEYHWWQEASTYIHTHVSSNNCWGLESCFVNCRNKSW